MRHHAIAMLAVASLAIPGAAQEAKTPPDQVIRSTTREVVLDVIVRDKKGHLVTDLKPGDVKVVEDNVPQKIRTFQFVGGREQLEAETNAAKAERAQTESSNAGAPLPGANSLREINFVSIILGPMDPANLAFARQAIDEFLKNGAFPNTVMSVYRLDTRLRLVQPFTQDMAALNHATELATKAYFGRGETFATSALATQQSTMALNTVGQSIAGPPSLRQPLQTSDPTFRAYGAYIDASNPVSQAQIAQSTLENSLRFTENYVNGMTIIDSLRELVRSESRLQGRKVVLLLADGLPVPGERHELFSDLISRANLAGVTFYTVDTRGLSVHSPTEASFTAMNQAANDSALGRAMDGPGLAMPNVQAAFDAASEMDDILLSASADTEANLRELAATTGGNATFGTNVISGPMKRFMEDLRTHYELAYTPTSDVYDGHFRKIQVLISRPNVTVQTRKGYYALPELDGEPLQQFEVTALKEMNSRPLPSDFRYWSDLIEFRPNETSVECQVAFEIPVSSLSFQADPKSGEARLQASVFAVVLDENGNIVKKISRELFREMPANQIAAVKDQRIEYSEPIALPPGHYSFKTVVTDEKLQRSSAQHLSKVVVPGAQLSLSSVQVVKRVEPLPGPRNPMDPFETANQRVIPLLGDTVPSGKVQLYFVIYPPGDAAPDASKLTIALFRDGQQVSQSSSALPKPDETGSIPMLAQLDLKPGSYSLMVTAQEGTHAVRSARSLTVN